MKLYYAPSACSMAPHIVLEELGLKHDLDKVDLGTKKTENGGDFLAVNGKGYVPALDIGKGEMLTEVSTILQYLADTAGNEAVLPKFGSFARYRAMEMLNFVSSELHKGLGGLFNKAMPEDGRKAIIEKVSLRLDWLNGVLGKQDYLLGKSFSVADAYAFTVLNWGQWVGVDMAKWPNITAFLKRMAARPSVQAAMRAEGLLAAAA